MRGLGRDVRHAWRRLQRSPVFAVFSVVSLAVGIGATTAIYSAVHALFRPYDIRRIDEVLNLYHMRPPQAAFSQPEYRLPRRASNVVRRSCRVGARPTVLVSVRRGRSGDGRDREWQLLSSRRR